MNVPSNQNFQVAPTEELRALGRCWPGFLALGVGMVALGTIAIGWACIATLTVAATWLFGFVLLAAGMWEIVNVFWAGRWSGMLLHLLVGALYLFVGLIIVDQPMDAAVSLTLIMAIFLMVGGIFRIVFAISERFSGSAWVLLNGVASFLLGLLIYKQWPASGLWVIGLFVGIELILNGWTWIMLSLSVRKAIAKVPAKESAADTTTDSAEELTPLTSS